MHTLRRRGGSVRYIDAGEATWRPMVFLGGLATSVRAFELMEFARTTRRQLHLRAISVERNGFGGTPLDPSAGIDGAVDDVLAVLDRLGLDRVVLVAVSGGGPFAAALAARAPDRLISLHLAAAAAGCLIAESAGAAALAQETAGFAADPASFWRFPEASPVGRIPGFDQTAAAEGVRALGHQHAAAAMLHEWELLCAAPLPSLGHVHVPAFVYHGTRDEIVPPAHALAWRDALGGPVTLRLYEAEAHDVQYRHWDQILLDAAGGGSQTLICREGQTTLAAPDELEGLIRGGATLGLCAWAPNATVHSPPGC